MAHVNIEQDRCKSCGLCIAHCPLKILAISSKLNKRGVPYAYQKKNTACSGCGMCYAVCPECCIVIYQDTHTVKRKK